MEYGCGDRLENNTIQLLMRERIGVTDLSVRIPDSSRKLQFEHEWVTLDNCVELMKRGIPKIGATKVNSAAWISMGHDFFSLSKRFWSMGLILVYSLSNITVSSRHLAVPFCNIGYDAAYSWSGSD